MAGWPGAPGPTSTRARPGFLERASSSSSALQPCCGGFVLFFPERLAFDLQLHHPPLCLVQFDWHGGDFHPQLGRGLVDQVNCFVWQEPVGDVPVGKGCRGDEGGVENRHLVMNFVPLPQSAQDRDRVLDRGLTDKNRLESSLERRILLDVLAVLVECRCPDGVKLTTRQHRLEQVGGVHRAFSGDRHRRRYGVRR